MSFICFKLLLVLASIGTITRTAASENKDSARLGILETGPAPDQERGLRFCIAYFPRIYNLTADKTASHRAANLTMWDGCADSRPSVLPPTAQRWVVVNQSTDANCTLDQRVATLTELHAAGLVIQVEEPYAKMTVNQSKSAIPITFLPRRHAETLLNLTPPVEAVQYAIPHEQHFNYGFIIIWFVANFTVIMGSLWSAAVKSELWAKEDAAWRARQNGLAGVEHATLPETPSAQFTVATVIGAITFIIALLLLSYFFPSAMYYVVLVLFFIGSVSGLYTCLEALLARLPSCCDLGMTPPVPSWPWCRMRVTSVLLYLLSLTTGIVWLVYRDSPTAGWVLQDLLGVAFTLSVIRSVRLPSLRIATFFSVGLFIYDIFFVFITPMFTQDGRSVMEEVATGGGDKIVPLVLKVPYIIHTDFPECYSSDSYSLLGYGDMILPGLVVAYSAAVDKIFIGRHVYFLISSLGYGLGLILTFVAVYLMQSAQPALLYIVPMVLLPVMLAALIRREFKLLWHGRKQVSGPELIEDPPTGYNSVDTRRQ